MNCSVTLTAEEFKTLHNALWRLDQTRDPMVEEQVAIIREALQGAYQQESDDSDRRYAHYDRIREELGLDTIWSMYEVDNLSDRHPFEGAKTVVYNCYSTEKTVVKPINGGTWAALFVAANACIRDSGDDHHIFIENFSSSKIDPFSLDLSTGS